MSADELKTRIEELEEVLGDLIRDRSERETIGGGPRWQQRHEDTWRRARAVYGEAHDQ